MRLGFCQKHTWRHPILVLLVLGVMVACGERPDEDGVEGMQSAGVLGQLPECAVISTDTTGWVEISGTYVPITVRLPPTYQRVGSADLEIWAESDRSISFLAVSETEGILSSLASDSQPPNRPWCSESIAGHTAALLVEYGKSTAGEGYHLQAAIPLRSGIEVQFVGFTEDSAAVSELVQIIRSVAPIQGADADVQG